jgi:hypothetical protein
MQALLCVAAAQRLFQPLGPNFAEPHALRAAALPAAAGLSAAAPDAVLRGTVVSGAAVPVLVAGPEHTPVSALAVAGLLAGVAIGYVAGASAAPSARTASRAGALVMQEGEKTPRSLGQAPRPGQRLPLELRDFATKKKMDVEDVDAVNEPTQMGDKREGNPFDESDPSKPRWAREAYQPRGISDATVAKPQYIETQDEPWHSTCRPSQGFESQDLLNAEKSAIGFMAA